MGKKALLMILDGWGIGDGSKSDVISSTPTPYWDSLLNTYPHSQLQASGENVGLPDGQMGNSEVGHFNIGAGRVVYQDLVKINKAIANGSILENPEIKSAFLMLRAPARACTSWDSHPLVACTVLSTTFMPFAISLRNTA
jgi:2,3-bisphosphoglycerate-independent phosphoglycerate mutase